MSNETALATRNGELAPRQETALVISQEQRTSIKSMIGSLIKTEAQFELFIATAQSLGLNPLNREIYGWTDYRDQNKLVTAIGIDGFRKKGAERCPYDAIEHAFCGEDGAWRDVWLAKSPPAACRCRIYLRGSSRAIEHVTYYDEFNVGTNPNWKNRPRHMMMIRSEAHAWRKVPGAGLATLDLYEETPEPPAATITEDRPAPEPAAAEPAEEIHEAQIVTPAPNPAPAPPSVAGKEPLDAKSINDRLIVRYRELGGKGAIEDIRIALGTEFESMKAVSPEQRLQFLDLLDKHNCLPGQPGWPLEPVIDEDPFAGQ